MAADKVRNRARGRLKLYACFRKYGDIIVVQKKYWSAIILGWSGFAYFVRGLTFSGKNNLTVVPTLSVLSISILPPCASMIVLHRLKPKP